MKTFQSNIQQYQSTSLKLSQVLNRLSTLRLIVFIFSLTIIVILANERLGTLLLIVFSLCVLGFGLIIKRYNQIAYDKRHAVFLKEINEDEVLKRENELSSFPTGQTFINRNHPYVSDLDIIGPHSLFQLLDRTTTESGSACLAEWLSVPASKEVILNAFGIISTHDLELAKLAGSHMSVSNYSFNSEIRNGEMSFDYQLTTEYAETSMQVN